MRYIKPLLAVVCLVLLVGIATAVVVVRGNNLLVSGDLNVTGNMKVLGNVSMIRPHAMFSDNTTQAVNQTGLPLVMNFSTTEDAYEVSISPGRQNISVQQNGVYEIIISAICKSTSQSKRVEIWVQKNGVDVPRSNTIYDFKGVGAAAIIAVPFLIELNTTDTFRVMYAGDDTGISIFSVAATGYSPATPSIIMTMVKVSELHQ